ncbi:hypothetical protein GIS00_22250 [Nakamurella sp. YIM 132087]|uniref:Uncharacterized protein n=1 Tax=Nakamurella alba TaxID=2665158 RepID=A0A7K1FR82_9ACTN|nr:hypothetical protein [Nakamurella alba]MTD16661.1 hypothetical protein [Nakamurella alba]
MSEVHDRARLSMVLADYAVTDPLGKLHMVGGGLQLLGRDRNTGNTAAFALVVSMSFPPEVFHEQYAFEVVLEDLTGSPVELPHQQPGSSSPVVRFGQSLQVEEPNFPGSGLPRRTLPGRTNVVLYFNTGLPLPAGQALVWRARIDGESKPDWVLPCWVPGPPSTPVIG